MYQDINFLLFFSYRSSYSANGITKWFTSHSNACSGTTWTCNATNCRWKWYIKACHLVNSTTSTNASTDWYSTASTCTFCKLENFMFLFLFLFFDYFIFRNFLWKLLWMNKCVVILSNKSFCCIYFIIKNICISLSHVFYLPDRPLLALLLFVLKFRNF